MGDGDLGITAAKGCARDARSTRRPTRPATTWASTSPALGMAVNRAALSTMGTLVATALMRAGKEAQGPGSAGRATLARMLTRPTRAIQERGKAQPGDKTLVDALHPAAEAFAAPSNAGDDAGETRARRCSPPRAAGRDAAVPLRSQIGRAGWVGERTEGQPDPGTVLLVNVVEALLGAEQSVIGSTT